MAGLGGRTTKDCRSAYQSHCARREDIRSNLNLITDKGNIYSFTLEDVSDQTGDPDLKVIVEPSDQSSIVASSGPPQYVPAAQMTVMENQLQGLQSHITQAVDAQRLQVPINAPQRAKEAVTFARDKNFEREAVVDERLLIRDALRRGMGELRYPEVRANLESRHKAREFVSIERSVHQTGRLFTTAKTIASEHEIVRQMRHGQNRLGPVLSRQNAIAVTDAHPTLNLAQKTVIEDVLSSHDRVQGIQGVAGAGKTTALSLIRTAAETQGYQVEGFAPTSRAAKQLEQAGVRSNTLQSFLVRSQEFDSQHRKLFFIDESSLASTNQVRDFLRRLRQEDRVLLVGDTRQHQGVEAGRPFEQLQKAGMTTAKLDQIVRQKDPLLKTEVEMLAKGQIASAIKSLEARGKVNEIVDPKERTSAIARNYVASPENTLIVSPDNKSRQELNAAVRQELKANGLLGTDDNTFCVLVPRQDMTGAERAWARLYETEDVVRFSRGSKSAGIERGSYGKIMNVNAAENLLTIEKSDGNRVTYDPRRLSGVTVYQTVERQFSTGERIQFTAPQKQLGVANREMGTIEKIAHDGSISLKLEDGRKIEFDAATLAHFDHGYAATSHSAQGLTADRVLINADTTAHPELLNARFAYVSVSRARIDAEIYTNNAEGLGSRLSADLGKTSALEFSQSIGGSTTKDFGMGQSI